MCVSKGELSSFSPVFSGHSSSQSSEDVFTIFSVELFISVLYPEAMCHWGVSPKSLLDSLPQISPALPQCFCALFPPLALNSLLSAPTCLPYAFLFLRQWNTGVYPQITLNASNVCAFSVSQLHRSVEFSISHIERLNMCFQSWGLILHRTRRCRCPRLTCMGSAFPALSLHAAALGFMGAERTRL